MGNGLIPTYAGNTVARRLLRVVVRAHPHVCGEHYVNHPALVADAGSSPRMRGTRKGLRVSAARCGLIPTYAGNTSGWCT